MNFTKNRKIGLLIIGIGFLISYIIYAFNKTLEGVLSMAQCSMESCPHEAALRFQTNISIIILILVIGVGFIFLFLREKPTLTKKNVEKLKTLTNEEKKIYDMVEKEGSIFQSNLVEQSGFTKVKVTRILDRLEGKQLIDRKRRGMTNIVIVK